MTFQAIIKNRLQTEEAIATQEQLDVVAGIMRARLASHKFETACLREMERRGISPFPHDVPVESVAAAVEDLVAFAPVGVFNERFFANESADRIWLVDFVNIPERLYRASMREGVPTYDLYGIIRTGMTFEELNTLDMEYSPWDMANYILLVAHLTADEMSEDDAHE